MVTRKVSNMNLKLQLNQLKSRNIGTFVEAELKYLIQNMLDNIGSVDPELRDNLIYPTFIRIFNENLLTFEQYCSILEICLDENHLFYKIGELNTDSVFTRSFSSLVITGILTKDSELNFLTLKNLECVMNRAIRDGYKRICRKKGWAHSIAHGADLLASLASHPKIIEELQFSKILQTVQQCLFKDATYIDDEDERLIFVIEALLEKGQSEKELEQWVLQIFNSLDLIFEKEGFSNKFFQTKFNVANFIKTFYFRIGFKYGDCRIRELMAEKLKDLHHRVYA
ncbi:membrane protein [Rummeliibacillus stabekisii]|nr:membrane protein [Rummeliibacillus stabekisii]